MMRKTGKFALKRHVCADAILVAMYGILLCSLCIGGRNTVHFYGLIALGIAETVHLSYLLATALWNLILKRNILSLRFIGVIFLEVVFMGLLLLTAFYSVFPA